MRKTTEYQAYIAEEKRRNHVAEQAKKRNPACKRRGLIGRFSVSPSPAAKGDERNTRSRLSLGRLAIRRLSSSSTQQSPATVADYYLEAGKAPWAVPSHDGPMAGELEESSLGSEPPPPSLVKAESESLEEISISGPQLHLGRASSRVNPLAKGTSGAMGGRHSMLRRQETFGAFEAEAEDGDEQEQEDELSPYSKLSWGSFSKRISRRIA